MRKDNEITNLRKITEKKIKVRKKLVDTKWIIRITLIALIISFVFSTLSEILIPNVNLLIGVTLVIIFIVIGVLFDMIGVAVTSADEKVFNSMAARKVKGSKLAVQFKKNAEKVSSFCNDVIGDICGIISGSAGAIIAATISMKIKGNAFIVSLVVTSIIAAVTIGGKALGKSFAINKSNMILFRFSKFLSIFTKKC